MTTNITYIITLRELRERTVNIVSSILSALSTTWEKIGHGINVCNECLSRRHRTDVHRYQHVFRKKTKLELLILSCAVCGIEFCYSAETAYVSPILLEMGLRVQYMTLVWCLSPIVGFLLTPILGSMSDTCNSTLGRRRPFIIALSVGIFLGLILVPNGKDIGTALGDSGDLYHHSNVSEGTLNVTYFNETDTSGHSNTNPYHPLGIVFTALGVILLDFCCDSCQSPSRSYLLDITLPEQHTYGLSMFTSMAGFGGCLGFVMGAIEWEGTAFATFFGGHVRVVFLIVTLFFLISVTITVTSFAEIPLQKLRNVNEPIETSTSYLKYQNEDTEFGQSSKTLYGSLGSESVEKGTYTTEMEIFNTNDSTLRKPPEEYCMAELAPPKVEETIDGQQTNIEWAPQPTRKDYFKSIIHLPKHLRILCMTNLFGWMSLMCYSLFFTDFVGEAVFGGDPFAEKTTSKYRLYEKGVRFGCWGMSMYSLSCCCYSYYIDSLAKKFGSKSLYVYGHMVYSLGMALMSLLQHPAAVLILSITPGIMYATIFTIPYHLVSQYHCVSKFGQEDGAKQTRGIGTDVAIVSSMMFAAQLILSSCVGSITYLVGSSAAIVFAASILSFCGAICATQVMYADE